MRPYRIALLFLLAGCNGTTGGGLIAFHAYASGIEGAQPGFSFDTFFGYHVTLDRAKMHVGAVYLLAGVPSTSFQSCIEPGRYVTEVPGPVDVDLLSPAPQKFSIDGTGSEEISASGEVWLTGGDINDPSSATVILDLAGTATSAVFRDRHAPPGGYPFTAQVTIGANRAIPSSDPSQPSLHPICKQRIVSGIIADLAIVEGGSLFLTIDPRTWFDTIDFRRIPKTMIEPPMYAIPDNNDGADGRSLFGGLLANAGVYSFSFRKE